MNKYVLTVGDVNTDIVMGGLPHMPKPEQDILATQMDILVGGQISTLARALARLGLPVLLVASIGNDFFGERARSQLMADGVDTSGLVVDPIHPTGATVVLSSRHERAFATCPGAVVQLRREHIPHDLLVRSTHLHLGSYYYYPHLRADLPDLFQQAKALGLTTSMDPGWDPKNEWSNDIFEVLKHVDVFIPNQDEAVRISGLSSPEAASESLAQYARTVVIKMGSKGCMVWTDGRLQQVKPFDVEVEDVTSAGDVFNAGYLYGFLAGWDALRSARFANACGAITVTRVGSQGIVQGLAEVQEFLAHRTAD